MKNIEESNQEDFKELEEEETSENDNSDETVEELKERLAKAEELAKNQKIRAEKAEKAAKKAGKPEEKETPKNENFSLADIRALSDVHDADVERVTKFAKDEGMTIAEAKNHSDLQAILASRAEARKVAEATNTGGGKRGANENSGDAMLREFESKGKLPEKDEDFTKLAAARIAQMKGKA